MIVLRYATVIKPIAMIFALKKRKGLSQTLKDLALTDQTNFSRFLWSASLVSRVEVWRGLSNTHHHLKWRNQGRSGASIIFKPNWDPNGRKKIFWRPQPLHLRLRMTAPLPYLKVWIRHWLVPLAIILIRLEQVPKQVLSIGHETRVRQDWKEQKSRDWNWR